MTSGYKPTLTELPGVDKHCERLQGAKRMIGLQAKIKQTRDGFLLIRVIDGVVVRWDSVTLSVRDRQIVL